MHYRTIVIQKNNELVEQAVKVTTQQDAKTGRWVKGGRPWNKGLRVHIPGSEKGWFKDGLKPHNLKPSGHERITFNKNDGHYYKYIKVNNKWILLHRYNYIKVYGEIPEGYILRCADGNTLNCDPANWLMITRAQNMALNRNHDKQKNTMLDKWDKERRRIKLGLPRQTKFRVNNI